MDHTQTRTKRTTLGQLIAMLAVIAIPVALIRMQNWCMNDTCRAAGDSAFGSIMELTFMFLLVQPVIHIANDVFHAPFLLVFALCYVDEPIRYVIMQVHMYSRKWISPCPRRAAPPSTPSGRSTG